MTVDNPLPRETELGCCVTGQSIPVSGSDTQGGFGDDQMGVCEAGDIVHRHAGRC